MTEKDEQQDDYRIVITEPRSENLMEAARHFNRILRQRRQTGQEIQDDLEDTATRIDKLSLSAG